MNRGSDHTIAIRIMSLYESSRRRVDARKNAIVAIARKTNRGIRFFNVAMNFLFFGSSILTDIN